MNTASEHGSTVTLKPQPIKEAAHGYLDRGFMPVPIRPGTKMPIGDAWQSKRYTHPDIEQVFAGRENIGIMLGDPSNGLVDIDLDCDEAIELAPQYLPHTPSVHGRGKRPGSHWWYIAPGLSTRQHRSLADKSSIVELRSTGAQTLVGPSVHPDDDIYDQLDTEPAVVDPTQLAQAVQALADAVMGKRHGPGWREQFGRPQTVQARVVKRMFDDSKIIERAIAYIDSMPAAISGAGGHNTAFAVANVLVHGFDLGQERSMSLFKAHYNDRCDPPWSDGEIAHKINSALTAGNHQHPRGYLRDAVQKRETVDYGVDLSGFLESIMDGFWSDHSVDTQIDSGESAYQPFPTDTIPEPIRSYVEEAADSIGCDAAYVALPMLSALAAAIGNTRRIRLKRSWTEPAIIWSGIVGESGTMKSPAITEALSATMERQKHSMRDHQSLKEQWLIEREMYESKLIEWKKLAGKGKASAEDRPEEPDMPVCERTWLADTTIEALISKLNENPRGLLLHRDELAGWIGSMDRYAGGSGGESAMWLEVFGGRAITVDRKTSGTLYVPSASVSICGGIQPGILERVMNQQMRDSGMLARFLIANPPRQPKQWRDQDVSAKTVEQMMKIFDELFALKMDILDNEETAPRQVLLSTHAESKMIEFVNRHGLEQFETTGDLAAAYSKLECYCPRFALIFHMIRESSGELPRNSTVSAQSVQDAERLVSWFTAETIRIYQWLSKDNTPPVIGEHCALFKLICERGGQITARELQTSNRKVYPKAADAKDALDELAKTGKGQWEYLPVGPTGGRPTRIFKLAEHKTTP